MYNQRGFKSEPPVSSKLEQPSSQGPRENGKWLSASFVIVFLSLSFFVSSLFESLRGSLSPFFVSCIFLFCFSFLVGSHRNADQDSPSPGIFDVPV